MSKLLLTLLLFFLLSPVWLLAQQDSVILKPKKLGVSDIIKPVDNEKEKTKIISGSRFPLAAGELPFSVHVITKEEIRQNGYETLVDALKMAPGIFTSQPGSAIEGETFLMRGLLGNSYTKILVNDIPIKPSFLASMPIGAQLPVREAERIEIIYGAGASLYGADASAGIINIITRQSDKPVYMQADLAVGLGEYSSANVMFGGKWGRDKNILHFFAYGSNAIYEDRLILRDYENNFNPDSYPKLTLNREFYKSLPNYKEEVWGNPTINNIPHLSRKFGFNLKFRRLSLSMEAMTRRDHSSLGLNPVAATYSNPLNYTGETVYRINLNLYKEKETKNRKTDFTFIRYRMDDNASISYVQNNLAVELFNLAKVEANNIDFANADALRPDIYQKYYNKYLSGTRFMYAVSDEYRIEHVRNYRLFKTSSLTLGGNMKYATGVPSTNFLLRPPNDDASIVFINPTTDFLNDTLTFPVLPRYWDNFETNLFGQLFYAGKKFNIAAGFNYSSFAAFNSKELDNEDDLNAQSVFLPRIAGLFKISENIYIRSSWGKAYRTPNVFYNANSYRISYQAPNEITRLPYTRLEAETTTSWESGIRFLTGKDIDLDFTYFINETNNLINYGRRTIEDNDFNYIVDLGYENAKGATIKFRGGTITTGFSLGNKIKGRYNYTWTKSTLNNQGFVENYFLPQYSGKIHQLRLIVQPFKTTSLIFDWRRVKRSEIENPSIDNSQLKFSTVDFVGRYAFTDHFDVYIKITNLGNNRISGIPATRTPDDLYSNSQYAAFTRLGMNYYIE